MKRPYVKPTLVPRGQLSHEPWLNRLANAILVPEEHHG